MKPKRVKKKFVHIKHIRNVPSFVFLGSSFRYSEAKPKYNALLKHVRTETTTDVQLLNLKTKGQDVWLAIMLFLFVCLFLFFFAPLEIVFFHMERSPLPVKS